VAFPLSLPVVGDGRIPRHREDQSTATSGLRYHCKRIQRRAARSSMSARTFSAEGRMLASTQTAKRFSDHRGRKSTVEIAVRPSGKLLYVSNRGYDSIV
jgi:Lactonase, 7-bladed beta-propeller